jgi:serine/threonine protein kinase/Tfp pilus assembly protein PilF
MSSTGERVGRYQIERPLASGGMGTLFLATDTTLDRLVVLKFLPEELRNDAAARQRLLREAKAASRLNHPNILTIHAEESIGERDFIVMEYVPGDSLAEMTAKGPLTLPLAISIGAQIASGLAAAHRANIIHRDMKPSNVLVFPDGRVKIADFGLAASRADLSEHATEEFAGTIGYSSPEQLQGSQIDHRSDLWSFGVMLYEMVTGRHPFAERHITAVAYAILHEDPPMPHEFRAGMPGELESLILGCLRKNPDERPQRAEDIFDALERLEVAKETASRQVASNGALSSIAVLPFANLSGNPEQGYFCEGVAEEITNSLATLKGLRVASRNTAFASRERFRDPVEIGHQLNVETVLEGSVRKRGDRLRVSVQLISVGDRTILWSQRFDRQELDVFAIQDEIAECIVRVLRIILTEEERRAISYISTENIEAYDAYLRGRQFFHQGRRRSIEYAREMYQRAIALDPKYVRAYAGVADCCSLLVHFYGDSEANTLEQADRFSRKALELDPALSEAHAARCFALWLMGKNDEAETEFQTAIRLNPGLFETYYFYGRGCFQHGNLERAAELFEQACHVRPDHEARYFAAQTYTAMGKTDRARESYRTALTLLIKHLELNPDDANAVTMGAVCHSRLGNREEGIVWAERAVKIDPADGRIQYNVACLFALAGESGRAIDCLQNAVKAGFAHMDWVEKDPDLDSLRDDPRFKSLHWRKVDQAVR